LHDRTRSDADPSAARQRQIHHRHQFPHRLVAEEAHADHEPDNLFGRQPPTADRRSACCCERFFDPLGVETRDELREELVAGRLHDSICNTRHRRILIARIRRNKPFEQLPEFRSNVIGLPLTDRHWV
jgi:hypothetical protein